ncbi:MAG TPA: hypothetical protein PKX71_01540 [Candidatus Avimonas sp.]|mgnify:CR=1 FL=1|jgi:energy-coupling factor transporter ATP-binding protein EcfA2|nr:hypothetical protein [Clostridiales bacterium]HOB36159.1 hypothetical protein [Candidatus Avimonas sp.]HQA15630.1 hypothetical protein [Candidatus Avimonas sp.]HQD37744.1 hypothetical protein [Candidatus Avimonas sp.]
MVQLILGNKGSGKTKRLIEMCNEATEKSKGHVVLIEKNNQLSYNITYRTRLVAADEYDIQGFDAFYGFISGMCAANYDITDIFVDSTLKITGYDFEKLAGFIEKLDSLSKKAEVNIVMTVSADKSSVPETVSKYALD